MATKNINRLGRQNVDQKMMDGFKKHQASLTALFIGGAQVPVADILTTLQERINTAANVVSTKATWQTAVAADIERRAKTKVFVSSLRQAIYVAFPGSIDALADFGLAPRKQRVVTPEAMLAASAKAKATRAARHTMGSRQKAKVTGTLPATHSPTTATPPATTAPPGTVPVPVGSTSAPAPAVPAAPAVPVVSPSAPAPVGPVVTSPHTPP